MITSDPSEPQVDCPVLAVAVGVLIRSDGSVLISRRSEQAAHGGLWEFPGGKLEAGETITAALRRELHEELGILVQVAEPWLQIRHTYPAQTVMLHVWRVRAWRGAPHSQEGQPLAWVLPEGLLDFAFPAADAPIIARLRQDADQMTQQARSKPISTAL